jgi:hypothetical protein
MVEQKRTFRTPGSVGQVVAASILGLCGIYLCVSAVLNENVVPAVVAAVQSASGLYLVVWHVRARRRGSRAGEQS